MTVSGIMGPKRNLDVEKAGENKQLQKSSREITAQYECDTGREREKFSAFRSLLARMGRLNKKRLPCSPKKTITSASSTEIVYRKLPLRVWNWNKTQTDQALDSYSFEDMKPHTFG